jgi:hypothetical protein
MTEKEISAFKDEDNQQPIPTSWRSTFSRIIDAFVAKDYQLNCRVERVLPISDETASQIKDYIHDYDEELVALPDETWDSSVCLWMGDQWDVIIDLWTVSEGLSDLTLSAQVVETDDGYAVNVYMVHVP